MVRVKKEKILCVEEKFSGNLLPRFNEIKKEPSKTQCKKLLIFHYPLLKGRLSIVQRSFECVTSPKIFILFEVG